MFDRLVWAMISYGFEIWGWKERERIERVQERYVRWMLRVSRQTPGYLVREELQREKMRGRTGMRAWGYERKLRKGKGGELARLCWEEMRERARERKVIGEWEKERRGFYEEKRWSIEEIENMREGRGVERKGDDKTRKETARKRKVQKKKGIEI